LIKDKVMSLILNKVSTKDKFITGDINPLATEVT